MDLNDVAFLKQLAHDAEKALTKARTQAVGTPKMREPWLKAYEQLCLGAGMLWRLTDQAKHPGRGPVGPHHWGIDDEPVDPFDIPPELPPPPKD